MNSIPPIARLVKDGAIALFVARRIVCRARDPSRAAVCAPIYIGHAARSSAKRARSIGAGWRACEEPSVPACRGIDAAWRLRDATQVLRSSRRAASRSILIGVA